MIDLPSVTWGCAQLAGKTKGDDEKKVVLSDSPGNQSEGRIYEVKHAQKERGRVLKSQEMNHSAKTSLSWEPLKQIGSVC